MVIPGRILVVLVGLVLTAACEFESDRIVFVDGTILTMDAGDTIAEGLAIEGHRIVAVGSSEEILAQADGRTRIVNLEGRTLLPGFIDAHSHFPGAGIFAVHADLNSPPIGTVESIEDIVELMRDRAGERTSSQWLIGVGYDDTLLAEKRHPTRIDLDAVSTDRPVAIMHISGHLAVANSAALSAIGIDREIVDPDGGRIQRDPATGEPTGVLEETAAAAVLERIQKPSILESFKILKAASREYLRAGVTTAQNGLANRRQMRALTMASRLGLLPIRLVLWPDAETADGMIAEGAEFGSFDRTWLNVGAVKLVADGSIQGYTGYLSEPYHVAPGKDDGFRGYPRMSPTELQQRVSKYHAAGLQVAVHGNGDAAIDMILDAVEQVGQAKDRPDARPIIVHAQMARGDQLDRMKQLGVIPSFFVLHTYYWGDRHRELFMGPRRAARMSPLRSAVDRGVRFTIHADTPVVPMEPLRLVWAAVNRRSTGGSVIGERERVTPMQALRAVTIDAAYQHFEEDIKGSLEPGKLADLVILSLSPLETPERIDEIQVVETFVGGRSLYRADGD